MTASNLALEWAELAYRFRLDRHMRQECLAMMFHYKRLAEGE